MRCIETAHCGIPSVSMRCLIQSTVMRIRGLTRRMLHHRHHQLTVARCLGCPCPQHHRPSPVQVVSRHRELRSSTTLWRREAHLNGLSSTIRTRHHTHESRLFNLLCRIHHRGVHARATCILNRHHRTEHWTRDTKLTQCLRTKEDTRSMTI